MLAADRYAIDIETRRYEAFAKNAYIVGEMTRRIRILALILSGTLHNHRMRYGRKIYDVISPTLMPSDV